MIPTELNLAQIQRAFRDLEEDLRPLLSGNVQLQGRRITDAGDSLNAGDYVTRREADSRYGFDATYERLKEVGLDGIKGTLADPQPVDLVQAPSTEAIRHTAVNTLYYDETNSVLKIPTGSGFLEIGGPSFPVLAPSGAVGAPSYSFSADTDVGMYYTGSALAFAYNGILQLEINGTEGRFVNGLEVDGTLQSDGAFDHNGGTFGVLGATPVAQQGSYTNATGLGLDDDLASYTADDESAVYTGIDNAQGGTPYAQLTDLNALRVAYENLRALTEDLTRFTWKLATDMALFGFLNAP